MQSEVVSTIIDENSTVSGCRLGQAGDASLGSVKKSVLSNVRCKHIFADGCVLINVTAQRISAQPGSIVYNIFDYSAEGLNVTAGDILAGVSNSDGTQIAMRSHMSIDGGKAWETAVLGNAQSFEQVYNNNVSVCPISLEKSNSESHDSAWKQLN